MYDVLDCHPVCASLVKVEKDSFVHLGELLAYNRMSVTQWHSCTKSHLNCFLGSRPIEHMSAWTSIIHAEKDCRCVHPGELHQGMSVVQSHSQGLSLTNHFHPQIPWKSRRPST